VMVVSKKLSFMKSQFLIKLFNYPNFVSWNVFFLKSLKQAAPFYVEESVVLRSVFFQDLKIPKGLIHVFFQIILTWIFPDLLYQSKLLKMLLIF
jgi:hypothetical protein